MMGKQKNWREIRAKLWMVFKKKQFKRWRLRSSPAKPNDYLKLELPRAWEPTCSRGSLLVGERKGSQSFVSYGDKAIHGRDAIDSRRITIPLYVGHFEYSKKRWTRSIMDGGGRPIHTNFRTKPY